jgi:NADPH:quinone reductase-like Zn-dependent oxidoreductase
MRRKIFIVNSTGSLNNLTLKEEELAAPEPHEVQVKVKSIGLNYADLFAIMGLYSATPETPFIPGLEYAGVIEQVGKEVSTLKPGDKVMGVTRFGAYATALNIHHHYVIPLPEGWSFEEGAAFPVQVLTAYYALVPLGALQKGQTVLIHSGAGGVGLQANRIAKKFDAYTIGVVGNKKKFDLLFKENYDQYIVRSPNFKEDVKKALQGKELNLVLETAGGKYFKWSYHLLAPMGRLVAYGSADFTPSGNRPNYLKLIWKYLKRPKVDPLKMITENKSVMGFNLIWLYEKADLMKQLLQEIFELNLDAPYIGERFTFAELPEACKKFKEGNTVGKVIINADIE